MLTKRRAYLATVIGSSLAFGAFLACSDDENTTKLPDAGADVGNDTFGPDTGGADVQADTYSPPTDAGDAGDGAVTVKVLATFGPSDLPDGVTLIPNDAGEYGTPLVGFNTNGKSATVQSDGGYTYFSSIRTPWVQTQRQPDILWVPSEGTAFATVTTFGPLDGSVPPAGLYALSTDGGDARQFNVDPTYVLGFPNAVKRVGDAYYITDSNGAIVRVDALTGATTVWSQHAWFAGNKAACPAAVLQTPRNFGLDGLAADANNLYVTNFDYGSVIKVPINTDGSPGTPVLLVQGLLNGGTDCSFQSANGIALDTDGSLYISMALKNTLYHVSKDGTKVELMVKGKPPLDQVGNMIVESIPGKKKRLLLTNFALGASLNDAGPLRQLLEIELPPDP